jgi:hypothetical protein
MQSLKGVTHQFMDLYNKRLLRIPE